MDVFKDYIAIGGDSKDYSIFDLTMPPVDTYVSFIALMSISEGSKIYWAKGFPKK
jgi:hypothetical protein